MIIRSNNQYNRNKGFTVIPFPCDMVFAIDLINQELPVFKQV